MNDTAGDRLALACPHLLRTGAGLSLSGNRCTLCGERFFPAAKACTRCCGHDFESVDFGFRGLLWSWTIQGFLPKRPYNGGETEADFRPYGVGYLEMPCGIKIESRLTVADPARLRIGMAMELTLDPYGTTPEGRRVATFAFRPCETIS